MSRLPVEPDSRNNSAAPLTVKFSWAAFAVWVVAGLVWFFGIDPLHSALALDTACFDEPVIGRRQRTAEMVSCSIAEGPAGWLFLGWCASFPLITMFVLERGLRRAIKARAKQQSHRE